MRVESDTVVTDSVTVHLMVPGCPPAKAPLPPVHHVHHTHHNHHHRHIYMAPPVPKAKALPVGKAKARFGKAKAPPVGKAKAKPPPPVRKATAKAPPVPKGLAFFWKAKAPPVGKAKAPPLPPPPPLAIDDEHLAILNGPFFSASRPLSGWPFLPIRDRCRFVRAGANGQCGATEGAIVVEEDGAVKEVVVPVVADGAEDDVVLPVDEECASDCSTLSRGRPTRDPYM